MLHINFLEHVVIGGFQCVKPGHTPDFWKTRPDAQTGGGRKRGRVRVSPDVRMINPNCSSVICKQTRRALLLKLKESIYSHTQKLLQIASNDIRIHDSINMGIYV